MTQKLVKGGFKPGVDFNLHPDGRMLASKEANEYLENYHSKQLENSQNSVVAYALPEPFPIRNYQFAICN